MYNQNNEELKCRTCKAPIRHPGCQSHCKHYLEWKKKHDEEKSRIEKAKYFERLGSFADTLKKKKKEF